jgi:hypothetical protein
MLFAWLLLVCSFALCRGNDGEPAFAETFVPVLSDSEERNLEEDVARIMKIVDASDDETLREAERLAQLSRGEVVTIKVVGPTLARADAYWPSPQEWPYRGEALRESGLAHHPILKIETDKVPRSDPYAPSQPATSGASASTAVDVRPKDIDSKVPSARRPVALDVPRGPYGADATPRSSDVEPESPGAWTHTSVSTNHDGRESSKIEADDAGASKLSAQAAAASILSAQEIAYLATHEFRQHVKGSTPTANIQMGTPKKDVYVILDTGSDKLVAKTWATIQRELQKLDAGLADAVEPSSSVYVRNLSKTYAKLYMNRTSLLGRSIGGPQQPKRGSITYGSGSALTVEGLDTVAIGNRTLAKFPISEIAEDSLPMLHTKQGISGILGLQHMMNKPDHESVFTRARRTGTLFSFGYCRGTDDDGVWIWNDQSKDGQEQKVIGQIHWALPLGKVQLTNISKNAKKPGKPASHGMHKMEMATFSQDPGAPVAGSSLLEEQQVAMPHGGIEPTPDPAAGVEPTTSGILDGKIREDINKVFEQIVDKVVDRVTGHKSESNVEVKGTFCTGEQGCAAIIDTGSNIIAGPKEALKEFAKNARVEADCSNLETLPNIQMMLGDMPIVLTPQSYVMRVKLPKGMRGSGGMSDPPGGMADMDGLLDGMAGPGDMDDMPGGMPRDMPAETRGGMPGAASGRAGSFAGVKFHERGRNLWQQAFQDLFRRNGVDLSVALHDSVDLQSVNEHDRLCMPALVPLDMETPSFGKLWVIGTPLFEQYYTRWSWPPNASTPSIFLAARSEAAACKVNASDDAKGAQPPYAAADGLSPSATHASVYGAQSESIAAAMPNATGKSPTQFITHRIGLLRRETTEGTRASTGYPRPAERPLGGLSQLSSSVRRSIREVDLYEIKYPHWAKGVSDL